MKSLALLLFAPALAVAQPADEPAPPVEAPVEPAKPEPVPEPAPQVANDVPHVPPRTWSFADPDHHELEIDLEMFGTGAYTHRDGPAISEFRLDRGELGTIIGLGNSAGAELRLETIRSAAEGGALGVDGDSIVIRVKRAQIFGDVAIDDLHLRGAGGITPDPWITALETDYPLRPLSATASERVLGWPTSDLAALGRASYGPVRLSISFGNGEGLDYPERNNGKTTTVVFEAQPLATRDARLRLAVVGRDGSVGPALVRDRRVGGAATLWTPMVSAGGELVQAWGIADRGDLVAFALAGWTEVRPIPKLSLAGRFTTLGYSDGGGRASSFGGAVAFEPWRGISHLAIDPGAHPRDAFGNIRLWLAFDRTTTSGAAMPIPGADAGAATTLLVIVSTTAPFTID